MAVILARVDIQNAAYERNNLWVKPVSEFKRNGPITPLKWVQKFILGKYKKEV